MTTSCQFVSTCNVFAAPPSWFIIRTSLFNNVWSSGHLCQGSGEWGHAVSRCFDRVNDRFERACRACVTLAELMSKMSQNSCMFKIAFFLGQTTSHECRTHSWSKYRHQIKRTNTWNFSSTMFCIFINRFQSVGPACERHDCVWWKKWETWFAF